MEYRAGIVLVSVELFPDVFVRGLPPEHRIAAERELPGERVIEVLVEGMLMPVVPAGASPAPVRLLSNWAFGQVICWFDHRPKDTWKAAPP